MRPQMFFCACGWLFFALLCKAQAPVANDAYARHLGDGAVQTAKGSFSAAMADIQAAIALRPNDGAGWYALGSLLGQMGDFPSAESAFRRVILLQPEMAKAHFGLALTLIGNPQNKEDWAGAIAECREALKLRPDYPEALNLLGAGLNQQGQFDPAIEALQRAVALAPNLAEAHFNLGLAFESKERLDDAVKQFQAAVAAKGSYPEASSALGKLLFRMEQTAQAKQELERALRLNPDLADAHYTRARIVQSEHRRQEAAGEFAIAKELSERQAKGIQSSQLSNQGLELAAKGDMASAAATLYQAIALKPDYGVPHYNLGLILADRGETGPAVAELSKAISLLPGQAAPWFELGRVLALAKHNQAALECMEWAVHLAPANTAMQAEFARVRSSADARSDQPQSQALSQPKFGASSNSAAAHLEYAARLTGTQDYQGAVGELLQALALEPGSKQARWALALAYAHLGQKDRAILEYRKLLIAFPEDAAISIALNKLLSTQTAH